MAAPNIVNVTSIYGKTTGLALTSSAQDVLTCPAEKVLKVNSIIVANVDGANADNVTVNWYNADNTTVYHIAKTVTGTLGVTGGGNFNTTGIITAGNLNVSGSTTFGNITGTISNLVVGAGASIVGVTTAASFEQSDGAKVATTGKAIAMSMVFGG